MGKLDSIQGHVRLTLEKLLGIKSDSIRVDDNWQDWNFKQLVNTLRKWTERNYCADRNNRNNPQYNRDKLLQTSQYDVKSWIFCESNDHKSVDCTQFKSIDERKKMIRDKRLCFNCTGRQHRASDCRSRRLCLNCNGKHHTSICDRIKTPSLMSNSDQNIIYPTVTIKVNGISVGLH